MRRLVLGVGRSVARRAASSSPSTPLLPVLPDGDTRLTLCLDLDECLIHGTADESEAESLSFMEPSGPEAAREAAAHSRLHRRHRGRGLGPADAEIDLPYLETPFRVHKRPLLSDFLMEASNELVLFTAADGYARCVAECIDPEGAAFQGRVLTRPHCTPMDAAGGVYAKDLAALGRPLERIVLMDDNLASALMHPDNVLPIQPFLGDPDDRGLGNVMPMLRTLAQVDDVREKLRGEYRVQQTLLEGVRALRAAQ